MRLFECQHCRNAVHFDNTACMVCGHVLGFVPDALRLATLEQSGDGAWRSIPDGYDYHFCDNATYGACNWLLPAEHGHGLCVACRHNSTVPDLSIADNLDHWRKLELAKRHLFYSLLRWRLPLPTMAEDPEAGLTFAFLADVSQPDGSVEPVMTGHDSGLITINIAEADDAERERRRTSMHEPYRTLLGHLRHEIGHYYWDRLVRDRGNLQRCRQLFGDDEADYGAALRRHYAEGPPPDWRDRYISAYATAHPWEDFAETWAHYIHIVDALETAYSFGLRIRPRIRDAGALESAVDFEPYAALRARDLVEAWVPLTVAINSVNRSMGQPDLYPFVMSETVFEKLQFIHELVHGLGAPPNG
jgi:hypothetical protein